MLKLLIPAAAALALVSFAAKTHATSADTAPVAQPAMGWHLSYDGPMAKLAYGVENSDQLALMMTCQPGDPTAVVYGEVQPEAAGLIQASMTTAAVDPMMGEEVRVSMAAPSLQTLSSQGYLRVRGEAGLFDIRADAGERQMASTFFAHCARSRA